ncbi:hypothetical protein [Hoeflea sp.]|uniref:hypothetical protein n=1 Tax=Hoeflea sp. TaxID=1940281 RepID=UPI003A8F63B6
MSNLANGTTKSIQMLMIFHHWRNSGREPWAKTRDAPSAGALRLAALTLHHQKQRKVIVSEAISISTGTATLDPARTAHYHEAIPVATWARDWRPVPA